MTRSVWITRGAKMKRIIVFEGPDGCGKTTLAKAVAARLTTERVEDPTLPSWMDAVYHHHGPYPMITHGSDLVNIYAGSMAPALRDYNHVVLDRCWVSEVPYGLAYRGGADRLSDFRQDYLDQEMRSCDHMIYLCLPPYEVALKNFQASKGAQYLDTIDQFRQVYEWYEGWGKRNDRRANFYTIDPFDGRGHANEIVNNV
jgi:thymidylate kinase